MPTSNDANEAEELELLLAKFPGSRVERFATIPAPRTTAILEHCRRLYGGQPGYAYIASARGPHFKGDTYKHQSWLPRMFAWPADADILARRAASDATYCDVYLAPLLRRTKSPKAGDNLLPGRWAWCDCDGEWTEHRVRALAELGSANVVRICSGYGHHVYVRLARRVAPERIERINHRLADVLNGDSKWSAAAMLRLAGTFNWKPVAADASARPFRVRRVS